MRAGAGCNVGAAGWDFFPRHQLGNSGGMYSENARTRKGSATIHEPGASRFFRFQCSRSLYESDIGSAMRCDSNPSPLSVQAACMIRNVCVSRQSLQCSQRRKRAVCFSATANFVGSGVLGAVGIVTLTKVKHRRELLFAALPVLFAIHQFIEGFVWLGLDG